jgi:tetratricopeptide (TPR) repeat protein
MRLGYFFTANQQLAEARRFYNKALAIAPKSDRARYNLGNLELLENRPQQALADFRQTLLGDFRSTGQAKAHYALGHEEESRRNLESMITNHNYLGLAETYAVRGDADRAFEWLDRAYEKRGPEMTWIKIDPAFRALRGDARYQALLRKMNLPE